MDDLHHRVQAMQLLDLPASVLIDGIFTHLSARDLLVLGSTSHYAHTLTDSDLVWARRLATDFHFPLHSSARPIAFSSTAGWKTIYARLAKPHVYVWGEPTHSRLGIDFEDLPDALNHFIERNRSAPFPLPVDGIAHPRILPDLSASTPAPSSNIGPPVQLHSTGWAFHALTSSGHVLIWGTLDGEQYVGIHRLSSHSDTPDQALRRAIGHAGASVDSPTVLPIPPLLRVTQLGCGRKHAVALARVRTRADDDGARAARSLLSSTAGSSVDSTSVNLAQAVLLEWQAWGDVVRIEPSVFDTSPAHSAEIVQVEAGWEYSAVLIHKRIDTSSNATRTISEVFCWLTGWSDNARRQPPAGRRLDEAEGHDERYAEAISSLPTIASITIQLPPLPAPPPGLLTRLQRNREDLRRGASSDAFDAYRAAAERGTSATKSTADEEQQLITRIAAGTSFLIALTSHGLVYRLELLRGRRVAHFDPAWTHTGRTEDVEALAFRAALYAAWNDPRAAQGEGEGWELLDSFCVPERIAACGAFAGVGGRGGDELRGYVDASIRISHISAHFRNFAVYSVGAISALRGSDAVGAEGTKSIVLLGDEASTMYPEGNARRRPPSRAQAAAGPSTGVTDSATTEVEGQEADDIFGTGSPPLVQPHIIPALQARSIIKVVHGDWHAGALDAQGRVVAWGNWSEGALGIWDSLPSEDEVLRRRTLARRRAAQVTRTDPASRVPDEGEAEGESWGENPMGGAGWWSPAQQVRGPLDRVRAGIAASRGWLAGASSSADSADNDTSDEHAQGAEEEAVEEDVEKRLQRRLRPRVHQRRVDEPTPVRFVDWKEARPPAAFVFDLAMSGQHSGALAVDVERAPGPAATSGSSARAEPTQANKTAEAAETAAIHARAAPGRPSVDTVLGSSPSPTTDRPPELEPEWAERLAFARSPTLTQRRFGGPSTFSARERSSENRPLNSHILSGPSFSPLRTPTRTMSHAQQMTSSRSAHDDLARAGRRAVTISFILSTLAIFGIFGGWEWASGSSSTADESGTTMMMRWPFSLAYFLPLLVPLSLYVVIARWTGEKLFRHS
ncbi:hypothetical protein V8E36_008044 [Tilletia maclaganii]